MKDNYAISRDENLIPHLKQTFIYVFIIGFLAYGYDFLNYTPTHDGMMIIKTHQWWEMSIGRFVVLYYAPIRGLMEIPWLVGILVLAYTALAVYLTMRILEIDFDVPRLFVVSSVFVLNAAYISHAAVYLFCWDTHALGLLFAVLSVYVSVRIQKIWGYLVSAFILAFSLGSFQSYIAVAVGLYLIVLCKLIIDGDEIKHLLITGVTYLATLICSGGFYYVLIRVFQHISNVEPYTQYGNTQTMKSMSIGSLLRGIPMYYKQVGQYFLTDDIYAGKVLCYMNALILLIGGIMWLYVFLKKVHGIPQRILLIVIAVIFPVGINCISVLLNGNIYQLMMFAYQLVYILALYPLLYMRDEFRRGMIPVVVLMFCISFGVLRYANDLFYHQKLIGEGTEARMTNILYDLDRDSDFDETTMPVVLMGDVSEAFKTDYENRYLYSRTGGITDSGSTMTYNTCFEWYTRYVYGRRYDFNPDGELRSRLEENPTVTQMPCYPSAGYCQVVDGCMVIKLND